MAFLIGSIYAQMLPTLSLYLVNRFHATPFELGLFFISLAASTIFVSQIIGVLSDKGMNRLLLISGGLTAGAIACVCFALSSNYWIALGLGVTFFSFAGITFPQIMALGREFADHSFRPEQVPIYNVILRSTFALSWVGGPPLGFILQHNLGSTSHYLWVALAHIVVGVTAWFFLPNTRSQKTSKIEEPSVSEELKTISETVAIPKTKARPKNQAISKPTIPFNLKIAFIACSILFGMHQSYIISLPQLLADFAIPSHKAGYIMGLAAGLEIPIMLMGGWLSSRISLITLMRLGAFAASLLYASIWFSSTLWHLFAVQILNAIFVGFVIGLGMTWFQDQMPKFAGTASSLFNNSINLGNILGSIMIGSIAAWFGYHNMYAVNALIALLAVLLLYWCQEENNRDTMSNNNRNSSHEINAEPSAPL